MGFLAPLAARFAAFSLRERILLVAVLLALLYAIADLTWFSPQKATAKRLQDQLKLQAAQLESMTKVVAELAKKPPGAPSQQQADREVQLQPVRDAEAVVARASTDLRPGEVIRTLSNAAPGIRLVSLKTLPSQVVFEPTVANPAKVASGATAVGSAAAAGSPQVPSFPRLYRHRVEVAVQGPYPAVASYLQALEKSLQGVYWEQFRMEAKYPETTMRFTLGILSTQQEFSLE
jgi:MSHA biogenesis protein MshJ